MLGWDRVREERVDSRWKSDWWAGKKLQGVEERFEIMDCGMVSLGWVEDDFGRVNGRLGRKYEG